MKSSSAAAAAAVLLFLPSSALGYTWTFKETPKQCGQVTISISGQGSPPYTVLILPSGPSPLPNNVEARLITEAKSSGDSSEITFQLKYPTNSQFVAVVSDQSGFGSGGTSVAAEVTSSDDNSCFDSTKSVQPTWFFHTDPNSQIVQCQKTRLWWTPSDVQGNVSFLGVIPGGQSFKIPQTSDATAKDGTGTGFDWTPNVRSGTTFHIVASDSRGTGNGGSSRTTVGDSQSTDGNQCLNNQSPSSTPGSPAGGSYPTDSSGNGTNGGGSSGGSSNIGAIVGGVVGGVFALIALALVLFCLRRRSRSRRSNEKAVDLLNADEGDESHRRQELPQYYEPEPFLIPDPTSTAAGSDSHGSDGRPISGGYSDRPSSRSGTPGPDAASTSAATRKTQPRPYRAVNIIQHDDAGPSEQKPPGEEEQETIELPPAYTNIRT
ncbi:hypothetical protein V5O48_012189 [Marasmius crinis-equi]|uniref:receptor protein-tyrosine kinase n=1 Tax=Marasmius crinis-equi TaxID=585013 RepID=A0ABR3F3S3_9AGAR